MVLCMYVRSYIDVYRNINTYTRMNKCMLLSLYVHVRMFGHLY